MPLLNKVEKTIQDGLAALNLTDQVPQNAAAMLANYGRMLLDQNRVMNLTAIKDEDGVAKLHMLDCAALLNTPELSLQDCKTLIDVGTGAGFPGMVLKILAPNLQVTLLDSLKKRLDWLQTVSASLQLENVSFIHARAEEASRLPQLRESFDFAAARAVADLRVLAELCLPFVKTGGLFLAMKSVDCDAELLAAADMIQTLGGSLETVFDYPIPNAHVTHRIISIRKLSPSPNTFPRKWNKMQKQAAAAKSPSPYNRNR